MFTSRQIAAAERDIDNNNWHRSSSGAARAYVYATRKDAQTPASKPRIGFWGWLVIALAIGAWAPIIIAILL